MSQTSTIPFTIGIYLVISFGRICMRRRKINILSALAGQRLGIEEVDEDIWLVSCMPYDLGYIDPEQRTVQTIGNPLGKRFSPVSPVRKQEGGGAGERNRTPVLSLESSCSTIELHPPAWDTKGLCPSAARRDGVLPGTFLAVKTAGGQA